MDMPLEQVNLPGILVSLVIFGFIFYPRFNRWPDTDSGRLLGHPRDYINSRRYFVYALFYLSTFALFAVALSNIKELNLLTDHLAPGTDTNNWVALLRELFGERSFVFCLILVSLSLMVPFVDRIDQRWRAALLNSARVPKETLDLKNELLKSLPFSRFNDTQLHNARNILKTLRGEAGIVGEHSTDTSSNSGILVNTLLQAFYLIDLTRTFDPNTLDRQNIDDIEDRIREIAAVSHFVEESDTISCKNYINQIENKISTLLEILARNCVRVIPNATHRYVILSGYGFNLNYTETSRIDFIKPSLLCVIWIIFATGLTILASLQLFDAIGISSGNPDIIANGWLTVERLYRWTLGGSVSYMIAVAFGVFFHEVSRREHDSRDLSTYLLAFVFSTLGSCVFFRLSNETFQWPYVWLAFSFGLLSIVAVESRHRDMISRREVLLQAAQIGGYYAIASGILQILIRVAFADYRLPSPVDGLAVFAFGFARGGAVAFLVAYTLLDAERAQIRKSKRHCPRIRYRKMVDSVVNGKTTELVVRDLSEQGAMVRLNPEVHPNEGDAVDLSFGFTDIQGQVIWVNKRRARIRFNADDPNLGNLRAFINTRMKEVYTS